MKNFKTFEQYADKDLEIFEDIMTSINPFDFESKEQYKQEIIDHCLVSHDVVPEKIDDFINEEWENTHDE